MNQKQYFNPQWGNPDHYKGYYVDGVFHYLDHNIFVINPENNQQIICKKEIEKLRTCIKKPELFGQTLKTLYSCVEWHNTVENAINELSIMLPYGLNDRFVRQLNLIENMYKKEAQPYIPFSDIFSSIYKSNKKLKGISLLCPELDRLTGGLLPGTICTIAGATGCMKTTTAVNVAYQAIKEGKNVCYLSLEETKEQLFSKLLSRVSVDINKKLAVQDIIQHKLDSEDENILLNEVLPKLKNLEGSFQIIDSQDLINLDFSTLETKFKEVNQYIVSQGGNGIDLLVVDHLQMLKFGNVNDDEYKVMNNYVNFFRKQCLSFLGEEKQISVILLSQINREGTAYAQKHNGAYLIQHLAEASELLRASSYIITVYTDAMSQITRLLKMGAIKLRNSQLPMDTIQVFADGAYYQVGDALPKQQDYSLSSILGNDNQPTMEYTQPIQQPELIQPTQPTMEYTQPIQQPELIQPTQSTQPTTNYTLEDILGGINL